MLSLRSPQAIALELFESSDIAHVQPRHRWPAREISGDCVFLNAQQASIETQGRDAPRAQLGQKWWVFAVSGTGDAWLMSQDGQQHIGFLDHDDGPDAVATPMDLNFGQWLQLADLLRQWEALDDEAFSALLTSLMEQISPGLGLRYPYGL